VGVSGRESCEELEANFTMREQVEALRLAAGPLMGLGDVAKLTVPKMTLVSAPTEGGTLCTRTFIPHRCHDAIGVLGAVSVATAAVIPGTPAAAVAADGAIDRVTVEHPTGTLDATVIVEFVDGRAVAKRSGILRTARKLMDGTVYPRA
jgi:4-oxalomesaconate tautomerase